ncbi:MAG: molybdopterin molybdotransferase MoeA [Hellea sp.]|nr:molybdopterin molybdotransferase MoeA [Hellea sp.]
MISVTEARRLIIQNADPLPLEEIPVQTCAGRINGEDLMALRTQPPFDASAMDGYAVRSEDAVQGNTLSVIGEAPAGLPFDGEVGPGQAVRIFTGGIIPNGADHIIIQEDVDRSEDQITVTDTQNPPRHIRKAGVDFHFGDGLFEDGTRLGALHSSVLASAGISEIKVHQKPRVAIFSNGDELTEIGAPARPGSIISSTQTALTSWLRAWGAEADYLGIARDSLESLAAMIEKAKGYDVIVPLGGASVGDYDLVKTAFETAGYEPLFSKIAVKPGKPTWFGRLGGRLILGLPGNPASGLVCAQIFLRPLIEALSGLTPSTDVPIQKAVLTDAVDANGPRANFLRADVKIAADGRLMATPFPRQDSSLLTPFAKASAFIVQMPNSRALEKDDLCNVMIWGEYP